MLSVWLHSAGGVTLAVKCLAQGQQHQEVDSEAISASFLFTVRSFSLSGNVLVYKLGTIPVSASEIRNWEVFEMKPVRRAPQLLPHRTMCSLFKNCPGFPVTTSPLIFLPISEHWLLAHSSKRWTFVPLLSKGNSDVQSWHRSADSLQIDRPWSLKHNNINKTISSRYLLWWFCEPRLCWLHLID